MNAPVAAKDIQDAAVQSVLRKLAIVWTEFEGELEATDLIRKLNRGQLRLTDYQAFLVNLRQQVVDGACWIARAASNISEDHFELRSTLIRHAATEHRDYRLLEDDFCATGGTRDAIRTANKNPGSEALSAWMFHTASKPDPFDMIGAMFIIEGLGSTKAAGWGRAVADQLGLDKKAVSFLLYHGENDADHMEEFEDMLRLLPLDSALETRIVTCARVTGRLYAMQIGDIL
ncbi:iron-containing redox enzyme family protein [Hyphobacterium marinum]|uniref:Iron-containing redox enzyme family protein n=1 Tax=Hyphobacterium marinum TaxID=3116574 RepID=A0ABU7M172_9PROT|nr:iron-containing redox enzyme family protein [Hyphobacterium sp. Y6023]MEE2567436.1 iron-containing redox enzyme family protein [Hyphobacterium sp. Y6023]